MTMRKKLLITIACLSVILCTLVTGTIAWLIDDTATIENKFTPSNISVSLMETGAVKGDNNIFSKDFQMIPGKTYTKDPTVTVANDIPCYVFVKIVEANDFGNYMECTMAEGWTELTEDPGIYYRLVEITGDKQFPVLKNNQVKVKDTVTKAMMEALINAGTDKYPKLTFTAYAIQSENLEYGNATTEQEKARVAWDTLND